MNMAMTSVRRIFVDTNVLTRATIDAAPLHHEARTTLDNLWDAGAKLSFSYQVIREYVSNATRPQTYSPPLAMEVVLTQVESFHKSFLILPDSPAVLAKFLELVRKVPVGGKQIYDANIVATMLVYEIEELLTHNVKDFERFQPYIRIIPLVEVSP
jgi:predicted nucleic acid-binding protein